MVPWDVEQVGDGNDDLSEATRDQVDGLVTSLEQLDEVLNALCVDCIHSSFALKDELDDHLLWSSLMRCLTP